MKPYQQRVIEERSQLTLKLELLDTFITSQTYADLPDAEKERLKRQHTIMESYIAVLTERINAFVLNADYAA